MSTKFIDPVCGMEVDGGAPLHTTYKGEKYFFCAPSCLKQFESHPEKFSQSDSGKTAHHGHCGHHDEHSHHHHQDGCCGKHHHHS